MPNDVAHAQFAPAQIAIIKRTVASDTNANEFDLFMEACRSYRLDPFRKQIHCVVYNKDNEAKRKMTIIVSRDGCRIIAQRCGDYRPASQPPTYEVDPAEKSPCNPLGLVSATVTLFKQDNRGEWFPVAGQAYWDEFAPLKDDWQFDKEAGKRAPTGKKVLDASGQWAKMGRLMLAKCAEMQALRAGWPDEFGAIYSEEEMDRLSAETSAAEQLAQYEAEQRQKRIGGPALMMVFDDSGTLERVPIGKAHDRCVEYLEGSTPEEASKFEVRNNEALKEFWAHDKSAALAVKKILEQKSKQFAESVAAS